MIPDLRPAEGLRIVVSVIQGEVQIIPAGPAANPKATAYTTGVLRYAAAIFAEQRGQEALPGLFAVSK